MSERNSVLEIEKKKGLKKSIENGFVVEMYLKS